MFKKISFLFLNHNPKQTVIKNSFWLVFGQTIGRLIRAGLLIFAARLLGSASWGAFSYALSVAAFLSIFSDLGINAFITRELSRQKEKAFKLISAGLYLKITVVIFLASIIPPLSKFLTNIEEAKSLISLAVLIFAFDTIRDFAFAINRASEKMEIESLVNIFTNITITVFGLTFLFIYSSSSALILGYALGSLLGSIAMVFFIKKHLFYFFSKISFQNIKEVLRLSLPFSVMAIMGAVMINTDIIIIGWFKDAIETGLYSAAQKPIQLLYLLPASLAASVFPSLSKFATENKESFKKIFEQSLVFSILIALPISLGSFINSKAIILLLYGQEYFLSYPSFAILSLTLFIIFPSIIIGNGIFALNEQKKLIAFSLLGIFGNLILDLILIPKIGIIGCAWATLINQVVINSYLLYKIKKITNFSLFSYLKKIAIASFLMAVFSFSLNYLNINIIINITSSTLLYLSLLFLLKEKMIFSLIKK